MHLFNQGEYILNSGRSTGFKIDCDALTQEDITALAAMAYRLVPTFNKAIGIPTGGVRLAEAMQRYANASGPMLVCDDVLTTGNSMNKYLHEYPGSCGLVLFTRMVLPAEYPVVALFSLHPRLQGV